MHILIKEYYEDYVGTVDYELVVSSDTEEGLWEYKANKGLEDYETPNGGVQYCICEIERLSS